MNLNLKSIIDNINFKNNNINSLVIPTVDDAILNQKMNKFFEDNNISYLNMHIRNFESSNSSFLSKDSKPGKFDSTNQLLRDLFRPNDNDLTRNNLTPNNLTPNNLTLTSGGAFDPDSINDDVFVSKITDFFKSETNFSIFNLNELDLNENLFSINEIEICNVQQINVTKIHEWCNSLRLFFYDAKLVEYFFNLIKYFYMLIQDDINKQLIKFLKNEYGVNYSSKLYNTIKLYFKYKYEQDKKDNLDLYIMIKLILRKIIFNLHITYKPY
jgi:hypothetical protein